MPESFVESVDDALRSDLAGATRIGAVVGDRMMAALTLDHARHTPASRYVDKPIRRRQSLLF
jgi:hypothetical protein